MKAGSYKYQLWEKAQKEQQHCFDWLLKFVRDGEPRAFTKDELRQAAMAELSISKNSFDGTWILVIEMTGRYDWYEPLRTKKTLPS